MSRPKSKEMDLTVGNPFWSLLKFAIPVILGNLFQLFYTLADSVIVGKTLGADSLAAVGATSIIIYFVFCFINGFTGGFGICLGHQLLALASGAKTIKMKFGHHGGNHPVKDIDNNVVMITAQNHGFAVDEATLPANLRVTHKSLFDGTLQGIHRTDKPAFSFQGHPEASPGPHDAAPLFDHFIELIEQYRQSAK